MLCFILQWNLVCDRVIIESVVTSVFYLGIMVGALAGGIVADRYESNKLMQKSKVDFLIIRFCKSSLLDLVS